MTKHDIELIELIEQNYNVTEIDEVITALFAVEMHLKTKYPNSPRIHNLAMIRKVCRALKSSQQSYARVLLFIADIDPSGYDDFTENTEPERTIANALYNLTAKHFEV